MKNRRGPESRRKEKTREGLLLFWLFFSLCRSFFVIISRHAGFSFSGKTLESDRSGRDLPGSERQKGLLSFFFFSLRSSPSLRKKRKETTQHFSLSRFPLIKSLFLLLRRIRPFFQKIVLDSLFRAVLSFSLLCKVSGKTESRCNFLLN